ncbi:hypothetical protein MCOR25_006187 [Pyricularia grisea]|uniref:Uncharacterized protein n=1 Tax=Pyricularia grisea TaxID=148305 RepID=A0A6P8BHD6_PYRGI|nr:uncharacterized protein PgNI_01515 [Pyricularia grisea]KAI6362552.1 hypothetical protein MCOR25_006187 [Pyricularia grisea]TLD16291.1 hypothetical protein PgNI_01515 [Pyricularia grisea]
MPTNEPNLQHEAAEQDLGRSSNYKLQLDQAAKDALKSPSELKKSPTPPANPVVEKVAQYIPVVGKLLGGEKNEVKKPDPAPEQIPGPPERPVHDIQIEEFVRDQHRSRTQDLEDAKVQ